MPNTASTASMLSTGVSSGGGASGIGALAGGAGAAAFGLPPQLGSGIGSSLGGLVGGGGAPKTAQGGRDSTRGELAVMTALIQAKRWESADFEEKGYVARGGLPPKGHPLGQLSAIHGPQTDFSPISVALPNGTSVTVGTVHADGTPGNAGGRFSAAGGGAPGTTPPSGNASGLAAAKTSMTTILLIAGGAVLFLMLLFLLLR
jgi:hypothetical protein